MTREMKRCSRCRKMKNIFEDFYVCKGKHRADCKACTIKRNVKHQNRTQAWKKSFGGDLELRRDYMREYYKNNKERYSVYRERFRKNHPNYHRDYYHSRKTIGRGKRPKKQTPREGTLDV
jgi:hypothetical protein